MEDLELLREDVECSPSIYVSRDPTPVSLSGKDMIKEQQDAVKTVHAKRGERRCLNRGEK
jgi:hypothetical protein